MSGEIVKAMDLNDADALRAEINKLTDQLVGQFVGLEQGWMKLGNLLSQFKAGEGWRPLGYSSFPTFMKELEGRAKRGHTSMWKYLTAAEKLLPEVSAETLEQMGISKATELKNASKQSGKPLPQELIDIAAKPETTIKELRAAIGTMLNVDVSPQPGTWFDFGGCYMTTEERKEFQEAVKMTQTLLQLIPGIPDHVQRKEVLLSWAREFTGTHATEVYGPQATEPEPES